MSSAALTYVSYLELEQILSAQRPQSKGAEGFEHDEMLFIIIHQVYELWFKQILHEVDYLQKQLHANDTSRALHTLRRILTILKIVVGQIDILETMTPLEFNAFRDYLETSSGFQSVQFRELEFVLGYKRESILHQIPADLFGRERLEERYQQPTLWDTFLYYLTLNGVDVPAEHLKRDVTQAITPSATIQAILIDIYRHNPIINRICERLVDLDEGIQEWRYRHIKMVERTIGSKRGTGGSSGIKYLSQTLKPLFPDLWAIRAQL